MTSTVDPDRLAEALDELADRVHRLHPDDQHRLLVMLDQFTRDASEPDSPKAPRRKPR
jgi:ABC-type transporter Mla subunit MlaD